MSVALSRIRPQLLGLLSVLAILIVWQAVSASGLVRPIFLPSPQTTGSALWSLLTDGRFGNALFVSFLRIASATVLAVTLGSILGVLMGVSKTADALLSPVTEPLRYLPISALIPLLILWLGIGEAMKTTFLVLGITFYFIPLVAHAIRATPEEFIHVARSFGASRWRMIRSVYWPHALPHIFDGLIVINGIGWTYVVLAEIINGQNGLGYLINIAGRLQRSHEVFAGLILIALVAILSDRILRAIRQRYFFW